MGHGNKLQFSSLGQNMLVGADNPAGDALIKKIFSNREVLAWLLVNFIDEYKGCTVQEIMETYLPKATLTFGLEAVHAGEILPENVPLSNTEDKELLEGMAMNLLCCDDCRGLCPECGADLNREKCSCKPKPARGSGVWDALDDLKL